MASYAWVLEVRPVTKNSINGATKRYDQKCRRSWVPPGFLIFCDFRGHVYTIHDLNKGYRVFKEAFNHT